MDRQDRRDRKPKIIVNKKEIFGFLDRVGKDYRAKENAEKENQNIDDVIEENFIEVHTRAYLKGLNASQRILVQYLKKSGMSKNNLKSIDKFLDLHYDVSFKYKELYFSNFNKKISQNQLIKLCKYL